MELNLEAAETARRILYRAKESCYLSRAAAAWSSQVPPEAKQYGAKALLKRGHARAASNGLATLPLESLRIDVRERIAGIKPGPPQNKL